MDTKLTEEQIITLKEWRASLSGKKKPGLRRGGNFVTTNKNGGETTSMGGKNATGLGKRKGGEDRDVKKN